MQTNSARCSGVAALAAGLALSTVAQAEPPLYTPWPCDVTYTITQGHNGGSHVDFNSWAWDVGIPVGGEVSAPADGVVSHIRMDSTVGGCSSSYVNEANYVILDLGDGTSANLHHLEANSSTLSVGDFVKQGDVVGRVGLTGYVCGPHLHFQIQETCGSSFCASVPAELVDYGDPAYGSMLVSNNCPAEVPCPIVGAGETILDERMECFSRETPYWWRVAEGYDDHHYYTFGTDAAADETTGRYTFDVAMDGEYLVEVFIPSTEADTTNATYVLDAGTGPAALGSIDQSTQKGWVPLGEVTLAAGEARTLLLGDRTGESQDLERKIAYDAVRFTVVAPSDGGGGAGSGGEDAAGGHSVGGRDGAEGGAGGGDTDAREESDDGCSCSAVGAERKGGGGLGGLGAVGLLIGVGLMAGTRRRVRVRSEVR